MASHSNGFVFLRRQVYDAVAWGKDPPETWTRCISGSGCFQPALRTRPTSGAQGTCSLAYHQIIKGQSSRCLYTQVTFHYDSLMLFSCWSPLVHFESLSLICDTAAHYTHTTLHFGVAGKILDLFIETVSGVFRPHTMCSGTYNSPLFWLHAAHTFNML